MLRSAARKVAWLAKGAAIFWGAAFTLALLFGVASVAFGANGGNFILGKANVASALTKLTGNVNGSAMQVQSTNAGTNDSALSLNVQPGEAPMRVNSAEKVANLNSDLLDGKNSTAFVPAKTYSLSTAVQGPGGGEGVPVNLRCDEGDQVLAGGGQSAGPGADEDYLQRTQPVTDASGEGWQITVVDNGIANIAQMNATCADFPPLRP